MAVSALSYILEVERHRSRACAQGGLSVPMMIETEPPKEFSSFLVTNTRKGLVDTRRTREGLVRVGFSLVPLDEEPKFFDHIVRTLVCKAHEAGWKNQFSTIPDGVSYLTSNHLAPKSIVLSESLVERYRSDKLGVSPKLLEGVQVLQSPESSLPEGFALITTSPVGYYIRTGDYLGVQLFDPHRVITLVTYVA